MRRTRYHRRNLYNRIAAMQREYLKHSNSGRSEMYIYRTFIFPQFMISRATFYRWLATNPTKELTKLKEAWPSLFDNTDYKK